MYSSNDIKCPRCGKHFNSERGLSQHYRQSCMFLNQSQSNSTSMIASSSSTNQFKSTNIMEPIFKRQKYHNDSSLMNISKKSVDNNMLNFPNSCEQNDSSITHNSTNQFLLQKQHLHSVKSAYLLKDNHSSAEIDLLKILSDLNCHNSGYERIMTWAKFWNSNDIFLILPPTIISTSVMWLFVILVNDMIWRTCNLHILF